MYFHSRRRIPENERKNIHAYSIALYLLEFRHEHTTVWSFGGPTGCYQLWTLNLLYVIQHLYWETPSYWANKTYRSSSPLYDPCKSARTRLDSKRFRPLHYQLYFTTDLFNSPITDYSGLFELFRHLLTPTETPKVSTINCPYGSLQIL